MMLYRLGEERRREERYPLATNALLQVYVEDHVEQHEMSTRDISSGGAFFFTSRLLPIGAEVRVTLHLWIEGLRAIGQQSNVRLDVGGRVVRSEADGIAVGFGKDYTLSPEGRSRL